MFEGVEDIPTRLDLRQNLRQLTRRQFVAVKLYLVGYSHAEIGEIEHVSRSAISYRIERATARLSKRE